MSATSPFEQAIETLRAAGLEVQEEVYGFSLVLPGSPDLTAKCGVEYGGSLSLEVPQGESPGRWFFRPTTVEMTRLLLSAHALMQQEAKTDWVEALSWADIAEAD